MTDCDNCRRPCDHPYPEKNGVLGELVYCRAQVLVLLPYLPDMREGMLPPREKLAVTSKGAQRAPYEAAVEIYHTIDSRLAACGKDRHYVERHYIFGEDIESIARSYNEEAYRAERKLHQVLNYISSGRRPRWAATKLQEGITYAEWVGHYRKKQNQNIENRQEA